jgi:hypothetical protein
MDKQRARQLYELADRLSKLDVNTLSEEQLSHRNTMIAKLQEEVQEGITDTANDPGEYDQEGNMAKQDLATAANAAEELRSILDSDENLPEWVQSKITKAVDYLDTVRDYMKSKDQDVSEASQRVDSLVTDALKIMRGSDYQVDAVKAIKTVLGDREYNSRRGYYSFYVRQLMDMHGQEGIAETKKPSPRLTPVDIKKSEPVSEEINTEAYERLQKVFAFKNYES